MGNNSNKVIYSTDVIEFTTVAVQFCSYLEQSQGRKRGEFIDTMLKLIPMLYLKAQLLPHIESNGVFLPSDQVTEDDYNWVRAIIFDIVQPDDEYLVATSYEEDMQTDETCWKSISEQIADVYQPVRNFLATYKNGIEDCMQDALWHLVDQFELFWGECLVEVLRRLHQLRYVLNERVAGNGNDEDYE